MNNEGASRNFLFEILVCFCFIGCILQLRAAEKTKLPTTKTSYKHMDRIGGTKKPLLDNQKLERNEDVPVCNNAFLNYL
jgi:hypothetical protein